MNHDEPRHNDGAGPGPAEIAAGHEPSEVGVRGIFIFGAGMIALIALTLIVLAALMRGFTAEEKADGTTTADLVKDRPGEFPAPRLQRTTTYDMVEFRKAEDAALSSYGWEDPKAGIAQIPIDRAMTILAERVRPRPKPPAKPSGPETKPSASESGGKNP